MNGERIREIVLEVAEIEDGELTETGLFIEDYDMDSITAVAIQAAIELEFNVVFDDDQHARMTSLAALREILAEMITASALSRGEASPV